jgi:hypothetical protein
MQTLVIDTHTIVEKLEKSGFTRTQAEGITSALKELDLSALATKADLKDLKLDIYKFMFGAMAAQTALIVGLLQLLK